MFNDPLKLFPISVDFVPHCWVGFVVQRAAFLQTSKNWSFPIRGSIPQTMALSNPCTKSREAGPWPVRMWPSLGGWVRQTINRPVPWLILYLLLLSRSMEPPKQGLPLLNWCDYSAHHAGFSSYYKSVNLHWYLHISLVIWIWVHLWKIKLPFLGSQKSVSVPWG